VLPSVRSTSIVAAILFLFAQPARSDGAGCVGAVKRHAILASDAVDPDVFVWDRRLVLVRYSSGVWMATYRILRHTLLEKPGTHAVVVSCVPYAVHSRFSGTVQDAVGIRILGGQDRGRYGWVVEEDVHYYR
jgi:hypothetical protein